MKRCFSKEEFYRSLVIVAIEKAGRQDDQLLTLMILLHTFRLKVHREIELTDIGSSCTLDALSRSDIAEMIAAANITKRNRKTPDDRLNARHWCDLYQLRTPFEVGSLVPSEWQERVLELAIVLMDAGMIEDVCDEDCIFA